MGSGGWFGVGLGASTQKWGWVPDDTTDFIFAIIGEELGLVGTLCVSLLLRRPRLCGPAGRPAGGGHLRPASRRPAPTIWIVGQAIVNIGAVIGLIPITGVPLPLVSAGLSSLVTTMVALGMLMSFAAGNQAPPRRLPRPAPARRAAP